jgi:hypothetical protein
MVFPSAEFAHIGHRMRSAACLVSSFLLLAACGGSQPEAAAPEGALPEEGSAAEPAAAPEGAPETVAPATWSADLSKDEKTAIMKQRVLPKMKAALEAGLPEEFENVTCKTCHGPKFALPKDFLPKLAMENGKITAFDDEPEVAKFMAETVLPTMADALGLQPYDPATQQGFGCGGCHTVEM